MAKNNSWLIWLIAIIAVVALILAIIAMANASVTGEAIKWNKPKANIINANSCKADSVCEANDVDAYKLIAAKAVIPTIYGKGGNLDLFASDGSLSRLTISDYNVFISNSGLTIDKKLYVGTGLTINAFNGTGPAYACINAEGGLYKSQTKCV